MSKGFFAAFGGGLVLIALIVAYIFYSHRGDHLEPSGRILQIRSAALDESHSVLVVDFEATNTSDHPMTIRFLNIELHKADGSEPENSAIAASDLPVLFRYHKELGGIDHAPMHERDVIDPHRTARGTAAARFDMPLSDLQARKDVRLSIEDVTGAKLELTAK